MAMIFLDAISRLLKGRRNANRTAENEDVRQRHDGGGVYRFASAAERTISDCRRVGLLAAALSAQSGGDADCSPRDKVRKLTDAARAVGLYVPPMQVPSLGDIVSKRTGESAVYWNHDENAFYKVKNPEAKRPIKRTSEKDWPYEHVIHNILFPECPYEFIGITEDYGELRVVLKQRAIGTESFPTSKQIEQSLASRGLYQIDAYFFSDEIVSVTDVGEHGDNVLLGDDGIVYFIDPLIRLHHSAAETIRLLTGVEPELAIK